MTWHGKKSTLREIDPANNELSSEGPLYPHADEIKVEPEECPSVGPNIEEKAATSVVVARQLGELGYAKHRRPDNETPNDIFTD